MGASVAEVTTAAKSVSGATERLESVERAVSSENKYSSGGLPVCRLCGEVHADMTSHVEEAHGIKAKAYQKEYPGWPLEPRADSSFGSLGYRDRKQIDYSVKDIFGFWWDKKGEKDKKVMGFATPGPLTPRIDDNYVFDPEYTSVALLGLHLKDKVLTYGPTGSGKTSLWEQIAARLNYNFVRINFDAGITRSDLVGQWVVKGSEMTFAYGILPSGMVLPGTILCFDEWDTISEECSFVLQRPLETHSQILILEHGEQVITLHKHNLIVATANTAGMGDDTGLYSAGTRLQNFSQINRFSLTIEMNYLPAEEEQKILLKRFKTLEAMEAEFMVQVTNSIRNSFMQGQIAAPLSTRDLINWAEKYCIWGDIKKSAKYCFINRMPLEDREVVRQLIQRAFE